MLYELHSSHPGAAADQVCRCWIREACMSSPTGRFHLRVATPANEPQPPREPAAAELLRVGDLAKLTGKTVRAIHHYEELGLIEPVGRSKGHYRLFDPE